jgi:hypothetical protein
VWPAREEVTELLRESNVFEFGRDRIMVSKVDMEDDGQNCVVGFVNATEEEWVNSASGQMRRGRGWLALMAVGVSLVGTVIL